MSNFILLTQHICLLQISYTVNHENAAPVLDCAFSADGSTIFSVGADKAVRMWNLGQSTLPIDAHITAYFDH